MELTFRCSCVVNSCPSLHLLLPSRTEGPAFPVCTAAAARMHSRSARTPELTRLSFWLRSRIIFLALCSSRELFLYFVHQSWSLSHSVRTGPCSESSVFPAALPALYLTESFSSGVLKHSHRIPFFFLTLKTTATNSFPTVK